LEEGGGITYQSGKIVVHDRKLKATLSKMWATKGSSTIFGPSSRALPLQGVYCPQQEH